MTLEEAAQRVANADKNLKELNKQFEKARDERERIETMRFDARAKLDEAQTRLLDIVKS